MSTHSIVLHSFLFVPPTIFPTLFPTCETIVPPLFCWLYTLLSVDCTNHWLIRRGFYFVGIRWIFIDQSTLVQLRLWIVNISKVMQVLIGSLMSAKISREVHRWNYWLFEMSVTLFEIPVHSGEQQLPVQLYVSGDHRKLQLKLKSHEKETKKWSFQQTQSQH